MHRSLSSVAAIVLIAAPLSAHDMWIEPSNFTPRAGDIVSVRLLVGQGLLGDPLPRTESLIKQFVFEAPSGRKPIIGHEGGNPAGYLRVENAGLTVIGYHSNPSSVQETADKFNQYLSEEGLDSIAALRAGRNQTNAGVREMFSRCAKSLVLSGAPAAGQADRQMGFTLELLAERNPYTLRAGEDLPLRLTYENRPLTGALVIALNRSHPSEKVTARTAADGRVRLRLAPGGMWMIKAVHMLPAPAGSNADWSSYWASLTFGDNQ